MREDRENICKNLAIQAKKSAGITLIALVITIIVLLILAGVSINAVLGENGILTRAENAVEISRINSAKEQIELAVTATHMDRMKDKKPFDLGYIKDNIGKELDGLEILGTHGSPIDKVYVRFEDENFMIDEEGNVIHIGDVEFNTIPDLAVVPDQVVTGVDKVVLTLSTEVEVGQVTKIVTPTGEIKGGSGTYTVDKNGSYEFTVYTDQGTEINKTVTINNIKEDGYDLTGLMTGADGGHNCVYKTSFDETSHWSECTFCGEKVSVIGHTFTTTWKLGTESCVYTNDYTKICDCGYVEYGNKPCVWDGQTYGYGFEAHVHYKKCSICQTFVGDGNTYYIGTYGVGKLYTEEKSDEPCYTSGNVRLTCQNTGTCAVCKYNYSTKIHSLHKVTSDDKIKCEMCNTEYGTFSYVTTNTNTVPNTYSFISSVELKNGATLHTNLGGVRNVGGVFVEDYPTTTLDSINSDRTKATVTKTVTFSDTYKFSYSVYVSSYFIIEGYTYNVRANSTIIFPELEKPVINNIKQEDLTTVEGWTTSKKITISGTENYCDTVTATVKDDTGATIFKGSATVTNKQYSLSFTPALEADELGRTFTVEVVDACDNKAEKTFTVQKVDSKTPTLASKTEINSNWARSKKIDLEITDEGVGNVEVAFNDTSTYEKLTETDNKFQKTYKFIGDLYQEIEGQIYIKDGLGNLITEAITIGKVDNTSPNITNVSQNKSGDTTVITIEANDKNDVLNAEGSGIVGYTITRSKEIPNEKIYQGNNSFDINTPGTYYVWAKDSVGNIVQKEITVE